MNTVSLSTLAVFALSIFVINPQAALSHGVHAEELAGPAYGARFTYRDNAPMAFAEIKVFAPGNPDKPYQAGRLDRDGCFMFKPGDAVGEWIMQADDGAGHFLKLTINTDNDAIPSTGVRRRANGSVHGVVAGAGYIFGVFGIWALFRSRFSVGKS